MLFWPFSHPDRFIYSLTYAGLAVYGGRVYFPLSWCTIVTPQSKQEENPGDVRISLLVSFLHCFYREQQRIFVGKWKRWNVSLIYGQRTCCQLHFLATVTNSCTLMMKFMQIYYRLVQQQKCVEAELLGRGAIRLRFRTQCAKWPHLNGIFYCISQRVVGWF